MNLGLRVKQDDLDLEPSQLTESLFEQFKPIRYDRALLLNIDKLVDTTLKDLAVIETEVNDYSHSSFLSLQEKIAQHSQNLNQIDSNLLKSSFLEVLLMTDSIYKFIKPHRDSILEALDERENTSNLLRIANDLCENFLRGNDLSLEKMSQIEINRTLLRTHQLLCWLQSDSIPLFLSSIYSKENLETIYPRVLESFKEQLALLVGKIKNMIISEKSDYELIKSGFEYLKKINKIDEINNLILESYPNLSLEEEYNLASPPRKMKDVMDTRFSELASPIFGDLKKVEEMLLNSKQEDFEFSKLISLIFKTKIHENIEKILKNYENNLPKLLNQIAFFAENIDQNLEKFFLVDNFDRFSLKKAAFGDLIDENYDILELEFLQDSLPCHPFAVFPEIFLDEETKNYDFTEFPNLTNFCPENFTQKLIDSTKETLFRAKKVKNEANLLDFYKKIFSEHFLGNLKSHIFSVSEKLAKTFEILFSVKNPFFSETSKKIALEKYFNSENIQKINESSYIFSAAEVLIEFIKICAESIFGAQKIFTEDFLPIFEADILISTQISEEFKKNVEEISEIINFLMEIYRKTILKIYKNIILKIKQENFCEIPEKNEKFIQKLKIKKNKNNEKISLKEICAEISEFFENLRKDHFSKLSEKKEVFVSTQNFREKIFCDFISEILNLLKTFKFKISESFSNILFLTETIFNEISSFEKISENSLLSKKMLILKYLHTIFMYEKNEDFSNPEKIFKNAMPDYFEDWKKLDEAEFLAFLRARIE